MTGLKINKEGLNYKIPGLMKVIARFFILIPLVAGLIVGSCGRGEKGENRAKGVENDTTGSAIITFTALEHDFGKVEEGEKVGCIFTYSNTGDADLVITSATASCGCTEPKYDKKPLPPGGSGTIEVIFDTSGREGIQTKTVVVQSNAENKLIILRIISDVVREVKK